MQHYDNARGRRRRSLIISYVSMTLAVIAISTVCVLFVLGYRFNFGSRQIEQGALLQVDSFPNGAQVILDGRMLSFSTPGKQEIQTATHDISVTKTGYRAWSKHFTPRAGEVRWLNYARLVPTTVETASLKEFSGLADELVAPKKDQIVVLPSSTSAELIWINVHDANNVTYANFTIPGSFLKLPTGASSTFSLVEWDKDAQYILVRHDVGTDKREYIRVNRTDPQDIINISTKFGVSLTDVHFSSSTTLYGIENGNLRRLDIGTSSLSEPLASSVESMRLYKDKTLAIVRNTQSRYEVNVLIDDTLSTVVNYDTTIPILAELTQYDNSYFLAITRGASFELIKNPHKSAENGLEKVVTLTYPGDIRWLQTSKNGRFIVAGNGAQFMTYDSELRQHSNTTLPNLSTTKATDAPQWLDAFILVSIADNKLRLVDFDGDNQQIITDALPTHAVLLSDDQKFLYSFSKNQSGVVNLQVSKMTVN